MKYFDQVSRIGFRANHSVRPARREFCKQSVSTCCCTRGNLGANPLQNFPLAGFCFGTPGFAMRGRLDTVARIERTVHHVSKRKLWVFIARAGSRGCIRATVKQPERLKVWRTSDVPVSTQFQTNTNPDAFGLGGSTPRTRAI
jgi:hypothetical protein